MKSFEPGFLENHPITHNLVQTIRLIAEFKGKQDLYKEQSPQLLETLRQAAIIQSTESSNRIEGITAPIDRIREIVAKKATPRNRSEQEIAGYREVLTTIHTNYADIPFTTGVVLQLHRDLYQFEIGEGGKWKPVDNEITELRPDGTKAVRFKPVPAFQTQDAMDQLHKRFDDLFQSRQIDPLLLIPTYILDFLCIHPFRDGNGRMARLLTLLLLYKSGFEVGRYISLEKMVEDTKESYYDTLYQSSQNWREAKHSLQPWWEYFLGVMLLGAYREFERRTGELTSAHGAKTELVLSVVHKLPSRFRYADLARACPNVSRPTIKRVLGSLREQGKILCVKAGRDAIWEKRVS
ncbi:MAG: Fic family protein [Deltaproteobacteria bacterium]|nr:Fic family protein [Deltaproteobacteria bacterium]